MSSLNSSTLRYRKNGFISAGNSCAKSQKLITRKINLLTPNQNIALNKELTMKLCISELK